MGGHPDATDLAHRTEAQQPHQLGIATAVSRVRSGSKGEVGSRIIDVCSTPKNGHKSRKSGHRITDAPLAPADVDFLRNPIEPITGH